MKLHRYFLSLFLVMTVRVAVACDAGYYLDGDSNCQGCESGYYCPGDDARHTCPSVQDFCDAAEAAESDLVKIDCYSESWGAIVNDVAQRASSIEHCRARPKITTNCGRYYYSVGYNTSSQIYPFSNTTTKYWQDKLKTGHYFSDAFSGGGVYRQCNDCTNAPSNAHYTGTGTVDVGDCPWACDNGYGQSGNVCVGNPITITWLDASAADISANNAGTATYGGNINTPLAAASKTGYMFTGWRFRLLPSGYTPLEYLESSGTQYIDTGIIVKSNTLAEFDYQFVQSNVYSNYVFGQIAGPGTCVLGYRSGNNVSNSIWWFQRNYPDTHDFLRHKVVYDIDGNVYRDNVAIATRGEFTCNPPQNYTILIFAERNDNDAINKGHVKIWNFKLKEDTMLVQDLVPAKRNSDGVLGMYDKVTNTFFTNAGTGTFVAGPEIPNVVNVPSGQ